MREGASDVFLVWLMQALGTESRVRLVDRSLLDGLLAELKLSSTSLVDPATALRLGRLLSARLIGLVNGAGSQVTVRVVETETSAVVASLVRTFPAGSPAQDLATSLGKELADKLQRAYPLRARVTSVVGDQVVLDIGTAEGARVGQRLQLFRDGPERGPMVAEVEIVGVEEHRSRARPIGPAPRLTRGLRVLAP